MQSTMKNMVVVLFVITLLSALAVGGVYMLTKDPIAKAKLEAENKARKEVLPEGIYSLVEQRDTTLDGATVTVCRMMRDSDGAMFYAVKSSADGYGGKITVMVGLDDSLHVQNIKVLEHKETPGVGANLTLDNEKNLVLKSLKGRAVTEHTKVKKDGGDVDALTAATISSRAYLDAVRLAVKAVEKATPQSDNKTEKGVNDGE